MLQNYFKIAIRNLKRNKLYSVINIAGLSVGLTAFILIILYVRYENSYENFFKNKDQIYQVLWKTNFNNNLHVGSRVSELMAPAVKQSFPQVIHIVRVNKSRQKLLVSYKNKRIYESGVFYADPSFFNIFSFHFIDGNPATALKNPNTVVITNKMARKYFGSSSPIGKTIRIGPDEDYIITGVISNNHPNTQFRFRFLAHLKQSKFNHWYFQNAYIYVMLRKGISRATLSKNLTSFFRKKVNKNLATHSSIGFEPLTGIHLSGIPNEPGNTTNPLYVFIFSAIGFLILIIASVNYMNLATAHFSDRAKELSVKKLLGADRRQLIFQLLGESLLLSLISMILALFLVELVLPLFNQIAGTGISPVDQMASGSFILILIGILLFTSFISGYYPALYLTKYPLAQKFNNAYQSSNSNSTFRKGLVVLQFIIATGIIIGSIVIESQLRYVNDKPLGFNKDNILVIADNTMALKTNYATFKHTLLNYPDIKMISSGSEPVVGNSFYLNLNISGNKGQKPTPHALQLLRVDYDYLNTLGVKIIDGRSFSRTYPTDQKNALLINQRLAEILGIKKPIGKKVIPSPAFGKVIGMIDNYHNHSLYQKTGPLMIQLSPGEHQTVLIRFQSKYKNNVIQQVKKVWHEYVPNRPLLYSFLNNDLSNLYSSDQRLASIFLSFSILAIFLACLGLFGLVAFSAERRTKEIGIRKVNGASVWDIIRLLIKDFLILVGIGFMIAIPIAWYAMHRWLQNFAYHIHIGIGVFLLAGVLAIVIALATVSWQSVKAALANPVDSLRNE